MYALGFSVNSSKLGGVFFSVAPPDSWDSFAPPAPVPLPEPFPRLSAVSRFWRETKNMFLSVVRSSPFSVSSMRSTRRRTDLTTKSM